MTLVCIFHQSWQKSLAPSPCQCHMLSLFYYVNSHTNYQKSSVPWCCVRQMAHYFTTEKSDSLQHPVECRSHRERGCKNSMLDLEQSENTISKEWMQDHIQRNRAWNNHKTQSPKNEHKTISTEERCRQYCFEYISASTPKSQFYLNFWRPTSISCEKVTMDTSIAILPQFLTSNVHFARNGCDWHLKIVILHQFLTSNVHFVRKGCVSWRSGGTAPALRERDRKKSERRSADVKVWRCRSADVQGVKM